MVHPPTIDCHHHLLDLARNPYPWLQGPSTKTHFGDTAALKNDYLISDYVADIKTQNIVKSVHIEAGWDPRDWRGETRWVQSIADEQGYPHAIVAFVDILAPDLRARLDALACHPNLRGVRMRFFDPDQLSGGGTFTSSLMSEPKWREGLALLSDYDLGFDLQAPPGLMAEAADLAAALPDIQLILTHAGLPLDRSDDGMEAWRQGMRLLAERENVAVKISGFPMTDWHWTVDSLRPLVLETIDLFGPARCMVGSNFPVDKLFSDFDKLFNAYRDITADFSSSDKRYLFHDTAARLYRL